MRRSWTASVSLLVLLLASVGADADWQRDYTRGKERVEKGQHREAIPLLRRAIQEKPRSCTGCIKVGMFVDDYFPHYFLGRALMAEGERTEALECFELLEAEGLIVRHKELASPFQAAFADARAAARPAAPAPPLMTEPTPAKPEPEPPPARVEPPIAPPARTPPPSPPAQRTEPGPDPKAVQAIRSKLDAAGRQVDSINSAEWRAHTKLQRFAQRLRQAIREASGRLDSTAPLQLSEMEALAARLQTQASRLVRIADLLRQYREIQASLGEERLKPHGDLAKEHAALDERMKGLAQQSLEGAGVREADDFIASLEGILRDLNGLATRLAQRPQAVPPPVAAAAPESRPAIEPPAPALSPAPRVREGFSAFRRGGLPA